MPLDVGPGDEPGRGPNPIWRKVFQALARSYENILPAAALGAIPDEPQGVLLAWIDSDPADVYGTSLDISQMPQEKERVYLNRALEIQRAVGPFATDAVLAETRTCIDHGLMLRAQLGTARIVFLLLTDEENGDFLAAGLLCALCLLGEEEWKLAPYGISNEYWHAICMYQNMLR